MAEKNEGQEEVVEETAEETAEETPDEATEETAEETAEDGEAAPDEIAEKNTDDTTAVVGTKIIFSGKTYDIPAGFTAEDVFENLQASLPELKNATLGKPDKTGAYRPTVNYGKKG